MGRAGLHSCSRRRRDGSVMRGRARTLPMARLLVNVDVDDLDKATRFYTEVFALPVGRRFGPFAVELLGLEAPLYLLVKKPGTPPFAGADTIRTYQRHWTPVHLDFAVEDVD